MSHLFCLAFAAGSLAILAGATTGETASPWRLACRLASYGKFQDAAWSHLPSIGVHHVFLSVPRPEEVAGPERLKGSRSDAAGHARAGRPGQPGCVDELAGQLAICEKLGVHYMFLSPRHTGVDKETAYERLRRAGEIARRHGVTIALETHPDLGTNGDVHLETMKRINHPNVRVNFDTGNITYYNDGADVVAELKKIIDYVATVELKDHGGRPRTWDFPALGQGKIDFPGVLAGPQGPPFLRARSPSRSRASRASPGTRPRPRRPSPTRWPILRKLAPFQ